LHLDYSVTLRSRLSASERSTASYHLLHNTSTTVLLRWRACDRVPAQQ
jgi:hypothetical protein